MLSVTGSVLTVKSHPLLLVWLSVLFLASEYRPGYVSECSDILLLILVGVDRILAGCLSRLESGCPLKCHNHAPYAYVITVPHFVYQCLILLLTDYIALTVICNHTLILSQPKAAWSATLLKHTKCFIMTWSTQMVKPDTISPLRHPYVWTIHTTTV